MLSEKCHAVSSQYSPGVRSGTLKLTKTRFRPLFFSHTTLNGWCIPFKNHVTCLGVIFDIDGLYANFI
jgi:hypothetical protein